MSRQSNPDQVEREYPWEAVRAIADTSRYDGTVEDRDLDAQCGLSAIQVLPLEARVELIRWLLA